MPEVVLTAVEDAVPFNGADIVLLKAMENIPAELKGLAMFVDAEDDVVGYDAVGIENEDRDAKVWPDGGIEDWSCSGRAMALKASGGEDMDSSKVVNSIIEDS